MRTLSILLACLATAACEEETAKLPLGDPCDRNDDCASDVCAGSVIDNCSETCKAPATEGSVCASISDTGIDCAGSFTIRCAEGLRCTLASLNNLGDQLTKECLSPQSEGAQCFSEFDHACQDGLSCVGPDAENMKCSLSCETDDDCGDGTHCADVACGRYCLGFLREDALCVEVSSSCSVSARCRDGLECAAGSGDGAFCGEPAEEGESCRTDLPLDDRDPADDGCADGLICAGGVCAPP